MTTMSQHFDEADGAEGVDGSDVAELEEVVIPGEDGDDLMCIIEFKLQSHFYKYVSFYIFGIRKCQILANEFKMFLGIGDLCNVQSIKLLYNQ
jgi:hypothetical protein